MSSNTSSNSDGSTRSLCSHGTIDPVELKKKQSKRKPPASWTPEEETVLVDFLLSQFSASGDGNPKGTTFTDAASLLKERFPNASGAEKTASICRNKWKSLKAAYNAVIDIKNTSEFTWSDEYGAGIVRKNDDVWNWYTKVCTSVAAAAPGTTNNAITQRHPAAKPYKNKGFKHFSAMEQMTPRISKGSHVYRQPPAPTSNDIPQATPPPFNLNQLMLRTWIVLLIKLL
ncbi:hypothetical protein DFH29DRAFT_810344 [Suillus ampliporus]|nr:hypothetical protein DFH29DRAFT_810344 [Suillus ampliporus]